MTFNRKHTLDEFETETGARFVALPAPEKGDTCAGCAFDGFTTVGNMECCGTPECSPNSRTDARDIIWVLAEPSPLDDSPPAYLEAKLGMAMPLLQEARDALMAITVTQLRLHNISPTLGSRMDAAGTYSVDDWRKEQS